MPAEAGTGGRHRFLHRAGLLTRILGIDFSGAAASWRPVCSRPTIWIATLETDRLIDLRPVQDLAGDKPPFLRLAELLKAGEFTSAGIDAPFSVPHAHLPAGGHRALVAAVDSLPLAGRPFPAADALLAVLGVDPPRKAYRACEQEWRGRGLNVRSSTWWKPRGGAPFTAACLKLIAQAGHPPCWPWVRTGDGVLAEIFPMAQLKVWGLPFVGYADRADRRGIIIEALSPRLDFGPWRRQCADSADALDAVVAALSAQAVANGTAPCPDRCDDEGWIAIAP